MRDLATKILSGSFHEFERWKNDEDPAKQAAYDLAMELRKRDRGPAYKSAIDIWRTIENSQRIKHSMDSYAIEELILQWEEIIREGMKGK